MSATATLPLPLELNEPEPREVDFDALLTTRLGDGSATRYDPETQMRVHDVTMQPVIAVPRADVECDSTTETEDSSHVIDDIVIDISV